MKLKPERWRQIENLYHAALERDAGERGHFLDLACAGDQQLRSEVESLLSSHDQAGSFLASPAMEVAAKTVEVEQLNLLADSMIGPYRIHSLIGRGGMGEVYLAQDSRLGRRVALKLLPAYFSQDEDRLRRFQQEARAASALNHPNIITIFEIGRADSTPFIATEYVQGETLRLRISGTRMSVDEALDVAIQIASALAAAHEAGIMHRDIKPENIMVRPDGIVKVLDFGLAKLAEKSDAARTEVPTIAKISTESGVVMGTANYMSPEQARGLEVDARTDIFSLGVVLYEMVAGRPPFEGETTSHVIVSILEDEPPPLARYSNEATEALEWIVAKSLTKDRDGRYQTAKELSTDLKRIKKRLEFEHEQERSQSGPSAEPRVMTAQMTGGMQAIDTGDEAVAQTGGRAANRTTSSAEMIITGIKRHKKGAATAVVALVVVIAALAFGIQKLAGRNQLAPKTAEPFGKVKVSRVTTNGQASLAAISPDGKYVAHAMGGKSRQSLWLRHIATGSDTEIVPTAEVDYTALTFSPDGNYIYFLRWESIEGGFYRVPVLGGLLKSLGRDVDGDITFSPDGRQIAYMHGYPQRDEALLVTANADGTQEQVLFTRHGQRDVYPSRDRAWGPAWSPDGEMIAFALRKADADKKNYWNVMTVRVKDQVEQQITFQKWTSLGQLAWLKDGSGLLVTAANQESAPAQQIWHVSYPGGEVRRITNDANNYNGIRLTADSTALVTVQAEQTSNLWIAPGGDASRAAQITTNNNEGVYGVCWTPDGRILYTTRTGGPTNIWIMNADGTSQKQLTGDARENVRPSITPDGRYIVFSSNRTGNYCIWRMDINGGNPKQLTGGAYGTRPDVSPDGQWIIYTDIEAGKQGLWKVSINGGNPAQMTDYTAGIAAVSPDGKQIALTFPDEQATPKRWRFAIIPFEGGPPTKVFDLPQPFGQLIRWTPDGRALTYVEVREGVSNIWSQPLDGGPPKQLTIFKTDQIVTYAWSHDGKQLVCARGSQKSDVVMISDLK
jgi:eukaryotic-like serine/threonine-protein kinase